MIYRIFQINNIKLIFIKIIFLQNNNNNNSNQQSKMGKSVRSKLMRRWRALRRGYV
jgi:hypothetical protein